MITDTSKTVRELALEVPNATRVFEKLGIDYCCGGNKPLWEACAASNLPVDEVLRSLEASAAAPQSASPADWQERHLTQLIDHIVEKHHTYVKQELPRLQQLLAKVASVHGRNHPEIQGIESTFAGLFEELTAHLTKEERILFPYIKVMEEAFLHGQKPPHPMFGTVKHPVEMMTMEHDSAGDALKKIRQTSSNFTPPPDACITYKTLYQAFAEFEADLHQHIHLENNILFPRAVEMEMHVPAAGRP